MDHSQNFPSHASSSAWGPPGPRSGPFPDQPSPEGRANYCFAWSAWVQLLYYQQTKNLLAPRVRVQRESGHRCVPAHCPRPFGVGRALEFGHRGVPVNAPCETGPRGGTQPDSQRFRFAPPRPQSGRAQRSVTSTEPARDGSRGVLTWAFRSAPNQHGSQHRLPKRALTLQFRQGLIASFRRGFGAGVQVIWCAGTSVVARL